MLFFFDNTKSFIQSARSSHSYKCPLCSKSFREPNLLYIHVESVHGDKIPEGTSARKFVYDLTHPGEHLCQICHVNKCVWKEKTGRYSTICDDPICREEARKRFLENYKKKNGKDHSIDDPKTQREMIRHKKTSGYYQFEDGGKVFYASSYEKDFLEFCDKSLEIPSNFIEECEYTFEYIYEDKKHFYLPDYYIRAYDLIIEIKADEDVTHPKILAVDKETEKLKDKAVQKDGTHNYIKICDKKYDAFIDLLKVLKNNYIDGKSKTTDKYIIIPERSDKVRGFTMPKLNFVADDHDFYRSEITRAIFESCRDKNNKAFVSLNIIRDYIPEEYKDDPLFKDGDIINNIYKCKEYQIDPLNESEMKKSMNEFKNYYTKQCEHFINQNYMSVRLKFVSRTIKYLDFSYVDEKKKKQFFDLITRYLGNSNIRYATIKKNLGYGIFLFDNELEKKEKIINDIKKSVVKRDYFTTETTIDNIESESVVIPGTVDGGTNVVFIDDYTNYDLEEK